jgi:hypothetical protein
VYYRDYIIVNFDHEVSPVEQGESANIFVLFRERTIQYIIDSFNWISIYNQKRKHLLC